MVKPGYKQTEIGVIPEDWECTLLLDKTILLNGLTYTPDNVKDHGLLVLRSSNIQDNQLSFEDTLYVDCIVDDEKKIRDGDILICVRNGSAALIGKCAQAHHDYDATFGAFMAVLRGEHNDYILQILQQGIIQREISKNSGATINQITNSDFKQIRIALPTLRDEEIAISTALSHVDKLISTIEKLIDKKNAIKQGAMQELLTGKRRLPGFSGEWENFNLMKHSKVKARIGWQGLKKSEYLDSGYSFLVTGTDFYDGRVRWDSCHYVTRSRYEQDRNIQLQNNDILITKDGSLGKVALVQGLTKPATLNSGIFVIRPLQNAYDSVFVYHILSSFVFKNFLDKLSAGSTIIHLYQKDVDKFEFLLPPTIEEQKAIAVVLSEMDADIAALEEKLTKYRQVKQGLMQQLLTGKIRLV